MKKLIMVLAVTWSLYSCTTNYETDTELDENMDVNKMTFMFYNTENLFDTIDDPLTQDQEFTPKSRKNWDSDKYYTKLDRIAEVIDDIDASDWPALVGLGEVENKRVLEDLVKNTKIDQAGYDIVHFNSPDERGIDMGLLYRSSYMNILEADYIRLSFPFNLNIKTRDILHVKAEFFNKEAIHVFVNHWPSRREGAEETAVKRNYVAQVLREEIDFLLEEEPEAKIVIMGDFNDYPNDESIAEILGAGNKSTGLYNLAYQLHKDGKGTINHKGEWGMIDQIIVTQNFFEEDGWYLKYKELSILDEDYLLYKDEKWGDYKPDKTFGGDNYYGGYSDHLPVYIKLKLKN